MTVFWYGRFSIQLCSRYLTKTRPWKREDICVKKFSRLPMDSQDQQKPPKRHVVPGNSCITTIYTSVHTSKTIQYLSKSRLWNTKIESSREFSMEITIYSPGLLAKASIHFEEAMSIPEFFFRYDLMKSASKCTFTVAYSSWIMVMK